MSEWEEFKQWKKETVKEPEESTGETIPENQRVELIKQDCKHENISIVKKRDDDLVDLYCNNCNCGFIVNYDDKLYEQAH